MTEIEIKTIETDAFIMRAVIQRLNGRSWAYADGVWYMPGTYIVLSPTRALAIEQAERRAAR
jgi:hypothetical protein